MQAKAVAWAESCRTLCEAASISFVGLQVDASATRGESPEAVARSARYQALADWLPAGGALLTAQHRDDQAETLLLQLLRGAGPKGLAAMPVQTSFGRGCLVRPLLDTGRAHIEAYARQHDLQWIEDPSNQDTRFDRNYLRQSVLPLLRQRWPGLSATLGRAARHQADQAELASLLAGQDLALCQQQGTPAALSVNRLQSLSAARQRNVLRHWIANQPLPLPGERVLQRVLSEVLMCRADSAPLVHWPGAEVRRYRDRLFVMSPLQKVDNAERFEWKVGASTRLSPLAGELSARAVTGAGLQPRFKGQTLSVRLRQGGELLMPAGRGQHHTLKKLFQEKDIPVWERDRVPLLYVGDELVAVAGLCVCEGYQALPAEQGLWPDWSRTKPYC